MRQRHELAPLRRVHVGRSHHCHHGCEGGGALSVCRYDLFGTVALVHDVCRLELVQFEVPKLGRLERLGHLDDVVEGGVGQYTELVRLELVRLNDLVALDLDVDLAVVRLGADLGRVVDADLDVFVFVVFNVFKIICYAGIRGPIRPATT